MGDRKRLVPSFHGGRMKDYGAMMSEIAQEASRSIQLRGDVVVHPPSIPTAWVVSVATTAAMWQVCRYDT
jgi:hypothetical protein